MRIFERNLRNSRHPRIFFTPKNDNPEKRIFMLCPFPGSPVILRLDKKRIGRRAIVAQEKGDVKQ